MRPPVDVTDAAPGLDAHVSELKYTRATTERTAVSTNTTQRQDPAREPGDAYIDATPRCLPG
jgi:hypothetical protein